MVITPAEASIHPSESLALFATVVDADGEPISGASVSWSISNAAIAGIEADGLDALLVPTWFGNIQVLATSEGAGAPPVPIRLLTEASLASGTSDINNVGQILATDHVLTPIPF